MHSRQVVDLPASADKLRSVLHLLPSVRWATVVSSLLLQVRWFLRTGGAGLRAGMESD